MTGIAADIGAVAADLVAGARSALGSPMGAAAVSGLVGVPVAELQTIVTAAGGVMPAIDEIRTGSPVKIVDGIFALAASAETVAVVFDPALAPVETITKVAAVLAELAAQYGRPGTFAGAAGPAAAADASDNAD